MCILLKLDYAMFGGSNLCFQKLSKKSLFFGGGGSSRTPIGKGRVNKFSKVVHPSVREVEFFAYLKPALSIQIIICARNKSLTVLESLTILKSKRKAPLMSVPLRPVFAF